jgi:hypothetical protein
LTNTLNSVKWYQDLRDRVVTVVEDGGWEFQMENFEPNKLYAEQKIEIQKICLAQSCKSERKFNCRNRRTLLN